MTIGIREVPPIRKAVMTAASILLIGALAAAAAGALQRDAVSIPDEENIYTGEAFVMDTFLSQQVWGEGGEALIADVEALAARLEAHWSAYQEGSVPDMVNKAAGKEPMVLSEEDFAIVEKVYDFSLQSGGRFDLTIAPLVKLWGINAGRTAPPAEEEIEAALAYTGLSHIQLDREKQSVFLDEPGAELDFGGSMKGYAVEQALALYQQSGITGGILDLGGNVAVTGTNPSREDGSFAIGLRDPLGEGYYAVLRAADRVICTSGGYERYFDYNGERYHHILDPQTGWPAETDLLSVTVIGEDGLYCDCLSTLFFMEGLEAVQQHLEEPDYALIAVDEKKRVWLSPSLKESFILRQESGYRLAE